MDSSKGLTPRTPDCASITNPSAIRHRFTVLHSAEPRAERSRLGLEVPGLVRLPEDPSRASRLRPSSALTVSTGSGNGLRACSDSQDLKASLLGT
jgi:hypothetical protein